MLGPRSDIGSVSQRWSGPDGGDLWPSNGRSPWTLLTQEAIDWLAGTSHLFVSNGLKGDSVISGDIWQRGLGGRLTALAIHACSYYPSHRSVKIVKSPKS